VCLALTAPGLPAADRVIEPLTVCEVLENPAAHEGKAVAVLGRYSFRHDGRSLNQESCGGNSPAGQAGAAHSIRLVDDTKSGPKPPDIFELDASAISRKLKSVKEHTALRTFRFGTPDYDRWAVVYGRLEAAKGAPAQAVRLVYRGDGVVIFLHEN
jgi:hypothetical protein